MAKCSKPNCKKPATKGPLCADHARLKQQEDLKIAQQKKQMEQSLKDTEEKRKQMAIDAKKKEETAAAKKKKIDEIAVTWNAQVRGVVTQVLALRDKYPEKTGINAGNNGDLGTIPGGTNNPIKFVVPSNTYGITSAEVFAKMNGFEGSDSGSFKFRVSEVFVHGH